MYIYIYKYIYLYISIAHDSAESSNFSPYEIAEDESEGEVCENACI
jgi:hypothetical protein